MSSTQKKAVTYDERNRQGKALEAHNKQMDQWNKISKGIVQKVGKDPSTNLAESAHHYRMRQEELGMIDASVPAEIKNGISAWEMNLRSGSGGIRYVQIGSSYPYPLYCPIRDTENGSPDHHNFMRVIPDHVAARNKPVSESVYFKGKQNEFKKHIKKKFGHFLSEAEPLRVHGLPPPLSKVPMKEDAGVEPVVLYPPPHGADTSDTPTTTKSGGQSGSTPNAVDALLERPQSRPLSAVQSNAGHQSRENTPLQTDRNQEGPMLMFSSSHLSFTTQPRVAAHATLRVTNIGSTAVFYSWSTLENDGILEEKRRIGHQSSQITSLHATSPDEGGASGSIGDDAADPNTQPQNSGGQAGGAGGQPLFRLSAPNDGVFMPDEDMFFTFMFRSATPGCFMQQYELLTVPAGKERIIVQLRGVVLSTESDALATATLSNALESRAPRDDARNLFTEILTAPSGNPLDKALVEMLVAERHHVQEEKVISEHELQEHRAKVWLRANRVLGIPFNSAVYQKIHDLHRQYHVLEDKIDYDVRHSCSTIATSGAGGLAAGRASVTPQPLGQTPSGSRAADRPGTGRSGRTETPVGTLNAKQASMVMGERLNNQSPVLRDNLPEIAVNESSPMGVPQICRPPSPLAAAVIPDWNGSVRSFIEDLTTAKDIQVRTSFLSTLNALTEAASCSQEPMEALNTLLMRSAAKQSWKDAIDQIATCSVTARDMVEGRGVLKSIPGLKDGKDKKGGAAAAAAKKPEKKGGANERGGMGVLPGEKSVDESPEAKEEYDDLFFNLCRRIVGDCVQNMFTLQENTADAIDSSCNREASVMLGWRMEDVVARSAEVENDLDPVMEVATKGKKK